MVGETHLKEIPDEFDQQNWSWLKCLNSQEFRELGLHILPLAQKTVSGCREMLYDIVLAGYLGWPRWPILVYLLCLFLSLALICSINP